jgi:hypothetical protein
MANAHRSGRPRVTTSRPDQKIAQAVTAAGRLTLFKLTKSIGNEQKMIAFTCSRVTTTFSVIESKIITEPMKLETGNIIINNYFFYQNSTSFM